jgi:hypothetical protein
MGTLREIESLKKIIENHQQEIEELKKMVLDLNNIVNVEKKINIINKSLSEGNDVSIIVCKYKKSVLIKNKYVDKNSTIKCKNILKELGAKWFKNENEQGWLFVGLLKENESLEDVCKFIIEKLNDNNYNLEIEYE